MPFLLSTENLDHFHLAGSNQKAEDEGSQLAWRQMNGLARYDSVQGVVPIHEALAFGRNPGKCYVERVLNCHGSCAIWDLGNRNRFFVGSKVDGLTFPTLDFYNLENVRRKLGATLAGETSKPLS